MTVLEQVALGGQGVARGLRDVLRPSAWIPFLPLVALEGVTLLALAVPTHPLVAWVVAPLVARAAGDRALHYPDGFAALPGLFGKLEALLLAVVGSLAAGAATHAAGARLLGRPVPAATSVRAALQRGPALVLALAPAHAALFGLGLAGAGLGAGGGLLAGAVGPAVEAGRGLVVMLAFLLPASVMLGGRGARGALAGLPRAWSRAGVTALLPVVVALVPVVIVGLPVVDPTALVERGTPELVAVVLAVRAWTGLAALCVLAGASALAYLGTSGDRG